jgi:hypothetical protein
LKIESDFFVGLIIEGSESKYRKNEIIIGSYGYNVKNSPLYKVDNELLESLKNIKNIKQFHQLLN